MKNNLRKLLSVVLSLLMVLSVNTASWADTEITQDGLIQMIIEPPAPGEKATHIEPQILEGSNIADFGKAVWFDDIGTTLDEEYKFQPGEKYGVKVKITLKPGYFINDGIRTLKATVNGDPNVEIKQGYDFETAHNIYRIEYRGFEPIPQSIVTGVTIDSNVGKVNREDSPIPFRADVDGFAAPQEIDWSVLGGVDGTKIEKDNNDNEVKLYISPKETAEELTVKAVYRRDTSHYAEHKVGIKNPFPSYKLTFTEDTISAEVNGKNVTNGSKVASGDTVTLKFNVPTDKEIKTFKIGDSDKTSEFKGKTEYTTVITQDLNFVLELQDKTAQATEHKLTYTQNIMAMVDGNTVATGNKVANNKEVILSLIVPAGEEIKTFTVNNQDKKSEVTPLSATSKRYKFNIKEDTDVKLVTGKIGSQPQPTEHKLTYTSNITAKVDGSTVATGNKVADNKEVILALTVPAGEEIKTFTVNNENKLTEELKNKKEYKFTITKDTDVKLTTGAKTTQPQQPVEKFELTYGSNISAKVDGNTVASGEKVEKNKKVMLTITPPAGKVIDTLTVNSDKVSATNNKYELTMTKATDVKVTFKNASTGGTTPAKPSTGGGGGGGGGSTAPKKPATTTAPATTNPTAPAITPATPKQTDDKKTDSKVTSAMTMQEAQAMVSAFNDANEITWSKSSVTKMIEKGIMKGYPNNTFMPRESVSRAQAAQVISALIGTPSSTITSTFGDVTQDKWYARAVSTAVEKGVFVGDSNGNFRPNDKITRAECFVAIAKFKGIAPLTDQEADEVLAVFTDASMVPTWAKGYVSALVKAEIVSGSNNMLNIQDEITREQLATIISNIVK